MSHLPEKNSDYRSQTYWDARYSAEAKEQGPETTFEWFKSYEDIKELVREIIPDKEARILMLGCGNSGLSADMYDDGYKNVVNIDYSPVVIEQMKSRHQTERPGMEWHEMDIRSLQFPDNSFDVAIDKGTMDALLTAEGDVWNPEPHIIDDCNKEVDEVLRTLRKPGGKMLYLTFGQPHFRKRYLTGERCGVETKLETRQIGDAFHYYLYILTCS